MKEYEIPWYILPVIVIAQFAGTSLWFAGNAVAPLLIEEYAMSASITGFMVSSVQVGFITGTLVFAFFTVADRVSPVKLFFLCSVLGAVSSLSIIFTEGNLALILLLRFLTGLFLAGIYPVGMKIAADWYDKKLGTALGWLVGALTLGTAFPHLIKLFPIVNNWESVFVFTAILSSSGGLLMILTVKDGPYRSKGTKLSLGGFLSTFKHKKFRGAAFGYFGHMWELYSFWTFLPILLLNLFVEYNLDYNVSIWSFAVIFIGMVGCISGGYGSIIMGSGKTAFIALVISGACCVVYPFVYNISGVLTLLLILLWGLTVIADSPQFSTLIANYAIPEYKGSALTLVNSIGFAFTIPSIEIINWLYVTGKIQYITIVLAIGPAVGIYFMLNSNILSINSARQKNNEKT